MADTLVPPSPLHGWAPEILRTPRVGAHRRGTFCRDGRPVGRPGRSGSHGRRRCSGSTSPPRRRPSAGADATRRLARSRGVADHPRSQSAPALESAPAGGGAPHGGAAIDVSGQRTTLRLRGAHARDVLEKGCSLDLHPRVYGPGTAAQTMLGLAGVILIPLDDDGADYRILVRSSFARYLAEWLVDAAAEFAVAR